MSFNIDTFIVHVKLHQNNNLEIDNKSIYDCRIHFNGDEEKQSLLCYSNTKRNYMVNYKNIIFSKGLLIRGKKLKLPLNDLQFYFKDDSDYQEYINYKSNVEEDENKIKNETKENLNVQIINKNKNNKTWADIAEEETIINKNLINKNDKKIEKQNIINDQKQVKEIKILNYQDKNQNSTSTDEFSIDYKIIEYEKQLLEIKQQLLKYNIKLKYELLDY